MIIDYTQSVLSKKGNMFSTSSTIIQPENFHQLFKISMSPPEIGYFKDIKNYNCVHSLNQLKRIKKMYFKDQSRSRGAFHCHYFYPRCHALLRIIIRTLRAVLRHPKPNLISASPSSFRSILLGKVTGVGDSFNAPKRTPLP